MNGLNAIIGTVGNVVDDLITTDQERREMDIEEMKLELQPRMGQIQTNIEEAKHASIFVAGWRPYAGWVAATAVGLTFIPKALVITAIWTYQSIVIVSQWNGAGTPPVLPEFPDLGILDLIGLLGTLLGTYGARTYERVKDKARSSL